MIERQVVLEVLLRESIEGGVVGLELLNTALGGLEVEKRRGDDGGDD
jgi:hypothetical protein